MKLVYRTLIAACLVAALASTATAGENANAKILLHLSEPVAKNICANVPADCKNAVTSGMVGNYYYAYVCIGNHSDSVGVAGVEFGIDYNGTVGQGVDVFSWNLCGDMNFPSDGFPGANTGNIVTWVRTTNCQVGPTTVAAGYFYIGAYTADRMTIIPRPVTGFAKVADCNVREDDLTGKIPSPLGYVDFGGGNGYNPCATVVPVQQATWSSVKGLFR